MAAAGPTRIDRGRERHWVPNPGIGYELAIPDLGVYLSLTRLRHESKETVGLLSIRVTYRGAHTIYGTQLLHYADFNCTSLQARRTLAKHIETRSNEDSIDWFGLLDELCVRLLQAEEDGQPSVLLHDIPLSTNDLSSDLNPGGLPLLRRLPSIWFGDGGAAKSYLALYAGIGLAQDGHRVMYLDWEFSGHEHRDRLQRLVGARPDLPTLRYIRCEKPLARIVPKLQREIHDHRITFVICDSIGFAADGTPESAEAATNYFRAFRELGEVGSLHLAHMSKLSKDDNSQPDKPFGSVFWSNAARNIWYLQRAENPVDPREVPIGFFHKKANTGPLCESFAMMAKFDGPNTYIYPGDITAYATLVKNTKASIPQRMRAALQEAPLGLTQAELEEQLKLKAFNDREALRKALGRGTEIKRDANNNEIPPSLLISGDGRYVLAH